MRADNGKNGVKDLSPVLWLGLPLLSLAICWLSPLLGYSRWFRLMIGEAGLLEGATVVFLLPAILLALLIFRRRRELPRGVGWVMLLAGLAALYFAGEESSWGQHYLGFETPASVAKVNRQEEFNLHNIRGWGICNNVPRQLMLAACIGGAILPLALHGRRQARAGAWYWLIPTTRLVAVSLLASLSTVPEKLFKAFAPNLPQDGYLFMAFVKPGGEFKEYCFAMVMMFYLLSVYSRMRRARARIPWQMRLRWLRLRLYGRSVPLADLRAIVRLSALSEE